MKLLLRRIASPLAAVWLAVLAAGCGAPEVENLNDELFYVRYAPLPEGSYHLKLAPVGDTIFASGKEGAVLRLRLKNLDFRAVTIPGWYRKEADNIILNLRPYRPDETTEEAVAAASEMIAIGPDFREGQEPPARSSLVLQPQNAVFVDFPLEFVAGAPPDKGAYFIGFVELNLESVWVYSDMFIIQVVPESTMQ